MADTIRSDGVAEDEAFPPPDDLTADALWDDWDVPPRVPGMPVLHLAGFDGPMDELLDLVERKRIDLASMSPLAIVDQVVATIEAMAQRISLDQRAEWIILVSRLVLLRSRLLLPASPAAAEEAEHALQRELRWLDERAAMRAAAAWLETRPQLGRDVFGRPRTGRDPGTASYMALMEACLAVLRGRDGAAAEADSYQVRVGGLWTMGMALAHMRAMLAERSEGGRSGWVCATDGGGAFA